MSLLKRMTSGAMVAALVAGHAVADPPYSVSVVEIQFNHNTSNETADGTTIKTSGGQTISAPEWDSGTNNPAAYVIGYSKTVKVKFSCTEPNAQNVSIWATKTAGDRLGDLDTASVDFSGGYSSYISFTIPSADVGSTIREKGTVTWTWKYGTNYVAATTTHDIYTIYGAPVGAESDPLVNILEYACEWADGDATAAAASQSIIDSMAVHYTYGGNCWLLSSDFVRLMNALGGSAALRRWSGYLVWEATQDEMVDQLTIAVDPVPTGGGTSAQGFRWHQWAEVATGTCDPSFGIKRSGDWDDYEDYLYDEYDYCDAADCDGDGPTDTQENQRGQSTGCEDYASGKAAFDSSPTVSSWTGP